MSLAARMPYQEAVKEDPMLKITITETPATQEWVLHGKLAASWVAELESNWENTRSQRDGRKCLVDLKDVTEIDGAACYLLRLMEAKNVTLSGGGIGIRALLGDDKGGK